MKQASIITAVISAVALILGSLWIIGQSGGFKPPNIVRVDTLTVLRVDTVEVGTVQSSIRRPDPSCRFEVRLESPNRTFMATHVDYDGDGGSYTTRTSTRRRLIDGYRTCGGRLVVFDKPRYGRVFDIRSGG